MPFIINNQEQPPMNNFYQPQNQNFNQFQFQNAYPQQQQQQFPNSNYHGFNSAENGDLKNTCAFDNGTIRAAFVRKVFSLLAIMLFIVAAMCSIPIFNPKFSVQIQTNFLFYFLALLIFIVVYFTLFCFESIRRTFPINFIFTGLLALSMGFMTMVITARYQTESIAMCFVITFICCLGIIIFATQTKYDITSCIGLLSILTFVVIAFGFVVIISNMFFKIKLLQTIYAAVSGILFMFYLAFDIQLIMGNRKYSISPEEYIFAAIQLFLDIINLFLVILQLFGKQD